MHHDQQSLIVPGRPMFPRRNSTSAGRRTNNLIAYGGQAVVLIRNPFDCLIAWWHHNLANSPNDLGVDKDRLRRSLFDGSEDFCRFAQSEIQMWREMYLDWILLADRVVVVHYENFREGKIGELSKMLRFMGIPLDEGRLGCVERMELNDYNRRGIELEENPYCQVARFVHMCTRFFERLKLLRFPVP